MNTAENEYHKRYNEAETKIGKHERAVHILRLKTRIHKDLLHVKAIHEERGRILSRLAAATCDHVRGPIQRELSVLRWEKRVRGDDARHLMLAYGFLRGKTYNQIETCLPGNEPNPDRIWAYLPDKGFAGETCLRQQLEEWLPQPEAEHKEAA